MYKKIYRSMCLMSAVTLALTALLILSACYTSFNSQFVEGIKNECIMSAEILNSCDFSDKSFDAFNDSDRNILIISKNGKVIFQNYEDYGKFNLLNLPEIKKAFKSGFGEDKRIDPKSKKMYYYCASRLKNNSVICVSAPENAVSSMLITVLLAVLFASSLIYIISFIVAVRLTKNIVKPLENIYSFDNLSIDGAYEEIRPFLKRIARQNDEIKRQMLKAQSQKTRLQAIMDNINEGLVIVDCFGEILSVNDGALKFFSSEEARVKHKDFSYLTERAEITESLKNALNGKKEEIICEIKNRTYRIFLSPMRENDKITGAVVLLFDISDRNQSEKIRREFTANVSHELKTPLTTIHGYAQIIGSGIAKEDDIKGFVKKIEKESSRLITLVDDIIELSHLDENAKTAQKNSFELKPVICEILENLSVRAEEKGISISVTGDDTSVYADISQVTEMIYNLLDNAIKYNKPNGKIDIKINNRELVISDTGIGIPEKYLDRIFERFFRVDKSRSKKVNGTGLGLSIVKHLAMINNAQIGVKSKEGEGTEFTVTFD